MRISNLPPRIAVRTTLVARGYKTPCWVCDLSINQWGYARVRWPTGISGKRVVHRVVYELFVGEVPEGMELDHLCRTTNCCRPSHLEAVSKATNVRRGNGPARAGERERAKTHCPAGHEYSVANTWVNKRGHRACRRCHANRARSAWQAARVEVRQEEDANVQDVLDAMENS